MSVVRKAAVNRRKSNAYWFQVLAIVWIIVGWVTNVWSDDNIRKHGDWATVCNKAGTNTACRTFAWDENNSVMAVDQFKDSGRLFIQLILQGSRPKGIAKLVFIVGGDAIELLPMIDYTDSGGRVVVSSDKRLEELFSAFRRGKSVTVGWSQRLSLTQAPEVVAQFSLHGFAEALEYIEQQDPKLSRSRKSQKLGPALLEAVEDGNVEEAERLLENGADPNTHDSLWRTALHTAAFLKQTAIVKLLISHGAAINKTDVFTHATPLHDAAYTGTKEIVQVLLAAGALIDARNERSRTPLHKAAVQGHESVVRVLVENAANVDAKDNNGNTALDLAIKNGHDNLRAWLKGKAKK
jgi:invasion protein IalB